MAGLRFFAEVDVLAGNLQELNAVAHAAAPRKELVPDPFGKRFFSATSWLGRMLLFFYNRFDRFDEKWRDKIIVKVMERTHRLYHKLYAEARCHNQCIKDSIQAKIGGRHVPESTVRQAKSFLTDWNAATVPFLKTTQNADYKFKEFLSIGFIDKQGKAAGAAPFGNGTQAAMSSRHQKVIDFEGFIGSPLPLALLYKVSTGTPLSKKEDERLASFAKKIDRRASSMKIHNLNKYLRALVNCFQEAQTTKAAPDLLKLATALVRRRSLIFNQKDPHHLEWRKQFKSGDKLNCNGINVVLGDAIGRKAAGVDNNLVFEVENAPELVAVFGINRLILPLKAQLAEDMCFGIRSAEYVQIENEGKFALVEKLEHKISDHQWTSTKLPPDQDDFELITPIICCIKWFLSQNRTPAHFHPDYLMYDANGELKCTKYSVPLPLSIIDLENYALTIAADNPHIFKYIMDNSEILEHEHTRYFRRIVETVCQGREPDPYALSQVMKIKDFHYVDRAKALAQEITLIKEECVAVLRERHTCPRDIARYVTETILREYTASGSISVLPPHLQETVLDKVERRVRLLPKSGTNVTRVPPVKVPRSAQTNSSPMNLLSGNAKFA